MSVQTPYSSAARKKRKPHTSTENVDSLKKRKLELVEMLPANSVKAGLTPSIPGTTYQQKILLLALLTGVSDEKQHDYCIATEMKEAEKFDDFIYVHQNNVSSNNQYKNITYDCYQLKHIENESEKVGIGKLNSLSKTGKFNLLKYFSSFRMSLITFSRYTMREFIICTNISLDEATSPIPDPFFNYTNFSRSKLSNLDQLKTLEGATYFRILANTLLDHLGGGNNISFSFEPVIFILYHIQLFEKNILVRYNDGKKTRVKFNEDFIDNKINDPNVKQFYEVLNEMCNLRKKLLSNLKDKSAPCIPSFGIKFIKSTEKLEQKSCKDFAVQISNLLNSTNQGSEKKLIITLTENVNVDFLTNLAGRVLFYSTDKCKVKFGLSFLNDESDDVKVLQQELREVLQSQKIMELKNYEICLPIKNYETCFEDIYPLNEFVPENKETIKKAQDEFLKKLVFLKTPNEKELDEVLAMKLGIHLKLEDVDHEQSFMEKHVLNWMKEKQGSYFTTNDTKHLLNKINQKLEIVGFIHSTDRYCKQLHRFSFKNEESKLQQFLTSNKKGIFYYITEYLLLASVKVHCLIKMLKKYERRDSYIFGEATSLLDEKIKLTVACQSKKSLRMVIVVCEKEMFQRMTEILKEIETRKKIVLITNQAIENSEYSESMEFMEENQFKSLTKKNQKKILRKTYIIFQGKDLPLGMLKDKELVSNAIFTNIIQQKEIVIGREIAHDNGYNASYYISRKFSRYIHYKDEVLQENMGFDDFVIQATNESVFRKNEKILTLIEKKRVKFESEFKNEITSQFPNLKNIHYFEQISENATDLAWKKSCKSINLLFYSTSRKEDPIYYDEYEMSSSIVRDKATIISNVAGMGKSTILTGMALLIKKHYPTYWIIKISLINYIEILSDPNANGEGLFKEMIKEEISAENSILFENFLEQKKVIIMLDGFDEVRQKGSSIDKLLDFLSNTTAQLCITTRTQYQRELESSLQTFSYFLEPFVESDQILFLEKFWLNQWFKMYKRELTSVKNTLFKKYVKEVIKRFYILNDIDIHSFIGIPLQLKMLAEIFQTNSEQWQGCFDYLNAAMDIEPLLPCDLNLFHFYTIFVDKKIELFLKEKHNTFSSRIIDLCKHQEKEDHTFLALKILLSQNHTLLEAKEFKKISTEFDASSTNKKQETGAIGIVIYTESSNKFIFIHLTYAEYFAAIYLVNEIESDINTAFQCMDEIMINSSMVFLHCITFLINDSPEKYNSCFKGMTLLNYAAANNYINIVKKLIPNENNCPQKDLRNRTPLQCAAINGNIKIVIYLLAYYSFCYNLSFNGPLDFINLANNIEFQDVHKKSAVDYAKQHPDILELFEKVIEIKNIYEQEDPPEDKSKTLDFSSTKYEIACKLLLKNFFLYPGNLRAAQLFLENIENEEMKQNIIKSTHFHSAILNSTELFPSDRNDKLQLLLNNGWVPKYEEKGSSVTFLIIQSIECRRYSTTKHFLKQETDEKFEKYLATACEYGNVKVINHLFKFYKQNIENPLHIISAFLNYDEIFFQIINTEWDEINVKDGYNGDTPLIIALKMKRGHEFIKFLLDKGATVNIQNNDGETALSVVIDKNINYGNLFYLMELLLSKESHPKHLVNIADNKGETPLFHAIRRINIPNDYDYYDDDKYEYEVRKTRSRVLTIADVVDFLIEHGANVDHKNNNGETLLDILPNVSEIPLGKFNIEVDIPRIYDSLLQYSTAGPTSNSTHLMNEEEHEDQKFSYDTSESSSNFSIYSSDSDSSGSSDVSNTLKKHLKLLETIAGSKTVIDEKR